MTRTPTLADVRAAAERAHERVQRWPAWMRELDTVRERRTTMTEKKKQAPLCDYIGPPCREMWPEWLLALTPEQAHALPVPEAPQSDEVDFKDLASGEIALDEGEPCIRSWADIDGTCCCSYCEGYADALPDAPDHAAAVHGCVGTGVARAPHRGHSRATLRAGSVRAPAPRTQHSRRCAVGSRTPLMQPADAEALRENLVRGHAGDVPSQIWVEAMLGTAGQGGDLVLAYHDELAASRAREQALRQEVETLRSDMHEASEALSKKRRERDEARAEVVMLRRSRAQAFADHDAAQDALARAEAEVERHEADLRDAAGDLPVEVPRPGTDAAKMLRANRRLRAEVERLRAGIHDLRCGLVRDLRPGDGTEPKPMVEVSSVVCCLDTLAREDGEG